MNCPDCHGALSIGAVKCRCGWKAGSVVETYPCAHDGCPKPAYLRRKINGCMVNLCRSHDEFHMNQEAKAYCKAKGLETVEQMRAFCKVKQSKLLKDMA